MRKTVESWHTEITKDADKNQSQYPNNTLSSQRNAASANFFALSMLNFKNSLTNM